MSLYLLNQVLNQATARFPGRSLRLHVETRPSDSAPFTYIFAKPVLHHEIERCRTPTKPLSRLSNKRYWTARMHRGPERRPTRETGPRTSPSPQPQPQLDLELEPADEAEDADADATRQDVWEHMRQKVEQTMEDDELGIASVRETIENALEQSGLLGARSQDESSRYIDALLEAITSADTERVAESIHGGSPEQPGPRSSEDANEPDSVSAAEAIDDADADAVDAVDVDEFASSRGSR